MPQLRLAAATAALVGSSLPARAAPAPQPGFVTTAGTHFQLDGKPFYFQGTNAADMAVLGAHSESDIYYAMSQYAARGLKVVRLWGYSCKGAFGGRAMVEWADGNGAHYNEDALERLDATLDAARSAGVKVIMTLVNFEPDYCGIDWWVRSITGSGDKQDFYKDARVKAVFKQHVATMLNRINTRYQKTTGTSLAYKDDPTLLAVEIMNEPHTQDGYDYSGYLVYHYLDEMSAFVRGIDSKHLIATGEEGYKTTIDPTLDTYEHAWINNGLKGVNFAANVNLPNVDFVTTHMYPDNWDIHSWEMPWVEAHIVQRRADLAHAAGKPIIMEESGFSNDGSWHPQLGFYQDPSTYLQQMYTAANRADFAGTMIWEIFPSGWYHHAYDYNFDDPVAAVVFGQAGYMNGRSR